MKGVSQGRVLSPLLFHFYSENINVGTLEDMDFGITINGMVVSNIWYADDTVVTSLSDLQNLPNVIIVHSSIAWLDLIAKKNEKVFSNSHDMDHPLKIDNNQVYQSYSFQIY